MKINDIVKIKSCATSPGDKRLSQYGQKWRVVYFDTHRNAVLAEDIKGTFMRWWNLNEIQHEMSSK